MFEPKVNIQNAVSNVTPFIAKSCYAVFVRGQVMAVYSEYDQTAETIQAATASVEHDILDSQAHLEARREFALAHPEFMREASLIADRLSQRSELSRKDLFLTGLELPFLFERHQKAVSALIALYSGEDETSGASAPHIISEIAS